MGYEPEIYSFQCCKEEGKMGDLFLKGVEKGEVPIPDQREMKTRITLQKK